LQSITSQYRSVVVFINKRVKTYESVKNIDDNNDCWQ